MRPISSLLVALWLLSVWSGAVYGQEHINPISSSQLEIDGLLGDWNSVRRHRAEHLVSGAIQEASGFSGYLSVAFDPEWLYLAISAHDDLIVEGEKGDQFSISIADTQGRRIKKLMFVPERSESADRFSFRLTSAGIKDSSVVYIAKTQYENNSFDYQLEIKLPITAIPWALGNSVRISATFNDIDQDGQLSRYSTHLVRRSGVSEVLTHTLGGASLFWEIYQQQNPTVNILAQLSCDWLGDASLEKLIITSAEILLFRPPTPHGQAYIKLIHGWPMGTVVSAIECIGKKPKMRLDILLDTPTGSKIIDRQRSYHLMRGHLRRLTLSRSSKTE